jgi:hypothetical protein
MAFSIALTGVQQRIRWMMIVPGGCFATYLATQTLVKHTGVTALGVLFPFVTCGLLYLLVKIRLAVEVIREKERIEMEEPQVVEA